MKINIKDLITIEGSEYTVAYKMTYNKENYIYLVNIDKIEDVKFCLIKEEKVYEVFDKTIVQNLILTIAQDLQK